MATEDSLLTPDEVPRQRGRTFWFNRRGNWLNLPIELAASLLAITTVPESLPPTNLPPWAIFVSWAGTFASGGPKKEIFKKIIPTMPIGSLTAFCIVVCFNAASHAHLSATAYVFVQMGILGALNSSQILLGRLVPFFGFLPGMFFGFSSYFATYYGGFGLTAHNSLSALWAVVLMNQVGVLYAWLNVKFMAPQDH